MPINMPQRQSGGLSNLMNMIRVGQMASGGGGSPTPPTDVTAVETPEQPQPDAMDRRIDTNMQNPETQVRMGLNSLNQMDMPFEQKRELAIPMLMALHGQGNINQPKQQQSNGLSNVGSIASLAALA